MQNDFGCVVKLLDRDTKVEKPNLRVGSGQNAIWNHD